jgi:2-oxoisovalerate dehydrogenase E2 component (dihydrolipoyl transacylase)
MADTRVIKVPDVGEGIAEVELVAWHVAVGDVVAEDQPLADVMTDKASVEIPSPVAGRVQALGGFVGQMLAVGAELIRIETADTGPARRAPAPAAAPAAVATAATASTAATAAARAAPAAADSPTAPTPAAGRAPPPTRAAAPPAAGGAARRRPIASPAVRRRAWELGLTLDDVPATGTAGRTTQADLDAHVAAHGVAPHAAAPHAAPRHAERHDEAAVPVIGLRRRIALQMQEAKRRIPHFSYVEEVDVTELETTRAALNARHAATRGRLTLLPLLMRALVGAVGEFPQVNARFDDEAGVVTRYGAVHLGVATDTPHGLLVPVLRHAEARDVWALAAELARLAEAARSGRATRAELSGSTITISSLGALGGIASTPVINRPEVAIVAVNRIVERPVAQGGSVVLRQRMNLSSSFDHRVIDGIDAARFVQALRMRLESPALLFAE